MKKVLFFALAAVAFCIASATPNAAAQLSVSIGEAPACPYGYYDYTPYQCAPYGYYGPEWFHGHAFIGAGPWFHGHNNFHGHVNNSFDPNHGYNGHMPERGEKSAYKTSYPHQFKGNEMRDGREHQREEHHEDQEHHDSH
jgi:hypothetical protein